MIIFTSICANYFSKAMVLAESAKKNNKDVKFAVCLVEDEVPERVKDFKYFDHIILAKNLGFKNFDQHIFQHSIVEASTAVKGQALKYLLNTFQDEDYFVYLDPDILVMSEMLELKNDLADNDIVLTPHLTIPELKKTRLATIDAVMDNELCALRHGVYNLGFLAIKRSPESIDFISWWADRLSMFCFDDIPRGIFTDQRWIDLAPCFFDVHILKHPGYNVAPWNLSRRIVTNEQGILYANNEPIRFVHFSGFDSGANEAMVAKYVPDTSNPIWKLRDDYISMLHEKDQEEFGSLKWTYDYFKSGENIRPETRVFFRNDPHSTRFINPFNESNAIVSGRIDLAGLKKYKSSPLYSIDTINKEVNKSNKKIKVEINSRQFVITGWAVDKKEKNLAGGVFFRIGDRYFPTNYGQNRYDVAAFHKNDGYINSGFFSTIDCSNLSRGKYDISIVILSQDKQSYYQKKEIIELQINS